MLFCFDGRLGNPKLLVMMRPVRYLGFAAITLMILTPPLHDLRAADITIRFIDGKTGTPFVVGHFQLWGCKGLEPPKRGSVEDCPKEWLWQASTDAEGKATFHLKDPLPPVLWVIPGALQTKGCTKAGGHKGNLETQQILREGIVTPDEMCDPKGKLKGKYAPKPGEVVIFCKRFTEWDHFLQEL